MESDAARGEDVFIRQLVKTPGNRAPPDFSERVYLKDELLA